MKKLEEKERIRYHAGTDYYGVLGVARDADDATIKKAYLALSRQYHPDVYYDDETIMPMLNEASEVLGDSDQKANYDRHLPRLDPLFAQRAIWGEDVWKDFANKTLADKINTSKNYDIEFMAARVPSTTDIVQYLDKFFDEMDAKAHARCQRAAQEDTDDLCPASAEAIYWQQIRRTYFSNRSDVLAGLQQRIQNGAAFEDIKSDMLINLGIYRDNLDTKASHVIEIAEAYKNDPNMKRHAVMASNLPAAEVPLTIPGRGEKFLETLKNPWMRGIAAAMTGALCLFGFLKSTSENNNFSPAKSAVPSSPSSQPIPPHTLPVTPSSPVDKTFANTVLQNVETTVSAGGYNHATKTFSHFQPTGQTNVDAAVQKMAAAMAQGGDKAGGAAQQALHDAMRDLTGGNEQHFQDLLHAYKGARDTAHAAGKSNQEIMNAALDAAQDKLNTLAQTPSSDPLAYLQNTWNHMTSSLGDHWNQFVSGFGGSVNAAEIPKNAVPLPNAHTAIASTPTPTPETSGFGWQDFDFGQGLGAFSAVMAAMQLVGTWKHIDNEERALLAAQTMAGALAAAGKANPFLSASLLAVNTVRASTKDAYEKKTEAFQSAQNDFGKAFKTEATTVSEKIRKYATVAGRSIQVGGSAFAAAQSTVANAVRDIGRTQEDKVVQPMLTQKAFEVPAFITHKTQDTLQALQDKTSEMTAQAQKVADDAVQCAGNVLNYAKASAASLFGGLFGRQQPVHG